LPSVNSVSSKLVFVIGKIL